MLIIRWTICVGVLFALLSQPAKADDTDTWPQWRGPKRNGEVTSGVWPDSLQEPRLRQRWRVALPPSYSGPIVSADKVFATFTRDKKYEGVRALDPKTGKKLWEAEWEGAMEVAKLGRSMGSWIRATPACDGKSLYVAGMPDLLVCLDPKSGNQRWRADFRARYKRPLPELGCVCSPLVVGNGVYMQVADSFVKVDKKTGKSLWRSLERPKKGSKGFGQGSYSSPDIGVVHGKPQLLVANIDAIAGVDPASGNVLWKRVLDSYDQGCIVAPIVYRDGIFTSTRASRTGYYPLTVRQKKFSVGDGWKNKLTIYMSSPVVIGDFAYAHLKNGRFACTDLRNGKVKWISKGTFGKYCSMVWRKDRILALNNDGRLLLLQANPERFVLVDSRKISTAETWGHIAIAQQHIFVREQNAITAFRWQ